MRRGKGKAKSFFRLVFPSLPLLFSFQIIISKGGKVIKK